MKKICIKFVGISISVLLLVVVIDYCYVSWKTTPVETDVYKEMPDGIQVCNFGSSHGQRSFVYDDWENDLSCFNFALSSQRYQYDYRLLMNYSKNIEKGAVVFIPFSYFSIWGTNDVEATEFLSRNNRYYKILPPELIIQYDPWVDVCQHYLPVLSAYDDVLDVLKDKLVGDGGNNSFENDTKDCYVDAEVQYNGQVMSLRDDDGNRIVNEERIEALYDMISYCQEEGYHPVLITTPLTYVFTDLIKERNPEFIHEFNETVRDIAAETNCEYYDYSMDNRICNNLDNFIDAHHLNEKGAKKFTSIIMQEIVSKYFTGLD